MLKQCGVLCIQHFGIGNLCHVPLAARSCTNICHIKMKWSRFLKSKVESVFKDTKVGIGGEVYSSKFANWEKGWNNFSAATSMRILLLYSNTVTWFSWIILRIWSFSLQTTQYWVEGRLHKNLHVQSQLY